MHALILSVLISDNIQVEKIKDAKIHEHLSEKNCEKVVFC